MTCPQLRAAFAAALVIGGVAACTRPASQPRVVGPVIGESTAQGPSDPSAPPPDPGGVKETSARIHGTPTQVANPVITVDTMPSTLEPSGNNSNTGYTNANGQVSPVVVAPGAGTGTAPTGTTTTPGSGTAGPNGPGTGNATTPTGRATGGAAAPPATVAPGTTAAPAAPTTPAPPSNGPGTGNTVNRATPAAPPPAAAPAPPAATPAPPATPRSATSGTMPISGIGTSATTASTPGGSQR